MTRDRDEPPIPPGAPSGAKPPLAVDAMVITNATLLDRLVSAAVRDGRVVWLAPAVQEECRNHHKGLPPGVRTYILSRREHEEVERLLVRTSPRGKGIPRDLRRYGLVGGLGEVQSMVIAKQVSGILVTDDRRARKVASIYLGGSDRALSSVEALRMLGELGR